MAVNDGYTVLPGSPPVINTAAGSVMFNPFGSIAGIQTTTGQTIIDTARSRHWSFTDVKMGDGAALLNLRLRQPELIALCGPDIEGLVGSSVQYSISRNAIAGSLLRVAGGVPYLAPEGEDGWAMHINADGVPYLDTTEPMLAGDPLQQRTGGLQGFPLPVSMIRLSDVKLLWENGYYESVTVMNERMRQSALPSRKPVMFISNNRLVPMRWQQSPVSGYDDFWTNATAIQVSYVGLPQPTTLTESMVLPDILVGALVAYITKLMSMQSDKCSERERDRFLAEEVRSLGDMKTASLGLTGSPETEDVLDNGF